MGSINFSAPFSLLKPVEVDPLKYATEYQNLAALAQERGLRQQQIAASQQEMQLRAQQMEQAQYNLAQQKAVNQAYTDAYEPDQNGVPQLNRDKLTQSLTKAGYGSSINALLKDWDAYDKSHIDLQTAQTGLDKARQDHLGNIASLIKTAGYDQNMAHTLVQHGMQEGTIDPVVGQQFINGLISHNATDPTGASAKAWLQPQVDAMIAQSPEQQGLLKTGQEIAASKAAQTASEATAESKQAETKMTNYRLGLLQNAQQSPADANKTIDEILPVDKYPTQNRDYKAEYSRAGVGMDDPNKISEAQMGVIQRATNWAQANSPEAFQAAANKAAAESQATEASRIRVAGAEGAARAQATFAAGGLTPDDIARAGEQYERTGIMPPLGRDQLTRAKIVAAGNAWARDQGMTPGDVVTMQAAYAGDKESLKNFQKQRDQIVSFEQTAQKNLNQFLDLASKIPDTGVPWLNAPIRTLDASVVGSANMAAINAARQVANNEIAKVTSGGGLSGVLSDAARNEVASYNPQNATFAQTKAVAQILKNDMANRHQSMDATLGDIKSRIGSGGQQVPSAPKATKRFNPQTKKLEDIP